MNELVSPGEGQPERKRRGYPDFVGDDPLSRRIFDIGVDAAAHLYADPGDEIAAVTKEKYTIREVVAYLVLSKIGSERGIDLQYKKDFFKETAEARGLINPMQTIFGVMPFVSTQEELLGKVNALRDFTGERAEAEWDQIVAEVKDQKYYPDIIGDDVNGQRLFDEALTAVVKGVGEKELKFFREYEKKQDLLIEKFPVDDNTFWKEQILREAVYRGGIRSEEEEIFERMMEANLPKNDKQRVKIFPRLSLFGKFRRKR